MYALTMAREEIEPTLTRLHEQAVQELDLLLKEAEVAVPTREPRAAGSIEGEIDRAFALRYACLAALFSLRA